MPVSKNRRFAKIANTVTSNGTLTADGISSDVTLGGATIYATRSALPVSGNTAGDQAFVTGNNRLYIWNGSGWYNVALLNLAPSITSVQDSDDGTTPFALAIDGTATTITITATDSDGDPITFSSTADSDFAGLATLSQDSSVFTITPFSQDSATTTSGTITFTASDGVNISTSGIQTFTLTFGPAWDATTQQAKVTASDAEASDSFGKSVAIDGDTAIVGAWLEDTGESNAGAAYIFTRSGSTWTQQQKIQASDIVASDFFGGSVAIAGDTAVVGCSLKDNGDASNSGAVYVFTRSGSTWTQQAKLVQSDPATNDRLGQSVAISGDTIIAGALYEDNKPGTYIADAGAAYIFTRSGSTWTEQQKIQASDAEASDNFGGSVAISGDTAIVGAQNEDTGAANAGAAYIFTRSGSTWTQQQKIQASDAEASDFFGGDVAIYGDNVVVGARAEDTGGSSAGAAYIFTRSGSTWTEQQKIQSSPVVASASFATAVAIDDDVVVCTSLENTSTGAAYIFTRDGSTWTQEQKIEASDKASEAWFGTAVAIDDNTIIVGAQYEDTIANNAGAAYIFVAG